jgi:predicted RNA-binding protein with PUA-like domain
MPAFLFKTEPDEYSFADLLRDGACVWEGVTNAAAVGHLRSAAVGDEVFIYHTGNEKAVVGLARVASPPRPDPKRPQLTAAGLVKFAVLDLAPIAACPKPVHLATIKADARFADFPLIRIPRLSVMPVPAVLAAALKVMGGLGASSRPSAGSKGSAFGRVR